MSKVSWFSIQGGGWESLINSMISELNTLGYDQYHLWGSNLVSKCRAWNGDGFKEEIVTEGAYPELAMFKALEIARAGGWEKYLDGRGFVKVQDDDLG